MDQKPKHGIYNYKTSKRNQKRVIVEQDHELWMSLSAIVRKQRSKLEKNNPCKDMKNVYSLFVLGMMSNLVSFPY